MVRKDVMKTAEMSIRKNRELLKLLASEDIANRKILQRDNQ
jgi:hypothetical protein